jgi:hypothetical protein
MSVAGVIYNKYIYNIIHYILYTDTIIYVASKKATIVPCSNIEV